MEHAPKPQNEVIDLPEDREVLMKKLEEYKGRIDEYQPPEFQIGTHYKIAVLKELVENGTVNRAEVHQRLVNEYGSVNESRFRNAWNVISDYVKTGGKRLVGGTGLPPRENTGPEE